MGLRLFREHEDTDPYITGIRGHILLPTNLLMKSLAQFYIKRNEPMEPLMSHAVFVDRLVDPSRAVGETLSMPDDPGVRARLGQVTPSVVRDNVVRNREQEITLYLLGVMVENTFPEVIGYPVPLHIADRGAKAIEKMVFPMLKSSERLGRANPLHRTLRQTRGG